VRVVVNGFWWIVMFNWTLEERTGLAAVEEETP
jgi:hypothetical protein